MDASNERALPLSQRGYDWIKEQYGIEEEAHGEPAAVR